MKKSVLLINILSICFFFSFCKNTKTQKTLETNTPGKTNVNDTTKISPKQTSVSGAATGQGIQKDTTVKTIKGNAIIHNAPEQEKIDSIKNALQKNKTK